MSAIVSFSKYISSLGSPDGTVTFQSPLSFSPRQVRTVQLLKATFSTQLPNIYTYGSFDNGLIKVSKDDGASWTSIQLPVGIYTLVYIDAALNGTISSWWHDSAYPGFRISYNKATQKVYVNIDSTKLASPGKLRIDFSNGIWDLLGFTGTKIFTLDGLYNADSYAKMDWFGNNVSIYVDGLGPLTLKNGAISNELVSVPLSMSKTSDANEYLYPADGVISPTILLPNCPDKIQNISFHFVGSRLESDGSQRKILIMEGNVEVVLKITWA